MKIFFNSLIAMGILFSSTVVTIASDYARPFPIIGITKKATVEQRASAEKLGQKLGAGVITSDTNPVCCVWLELRSWRPNPGSDGYVIIHQEGGTLISASSQHELDAAVERFIKSMRLHQGKYEAPIGLMTSYGIVK